MHPNEITVDLIMTPVIHFGGMTFLSTLYDDPETETAFLWFWMIEREKDGDINLLDVDDENLFELLQNATISALEQAAQEDNKYCNIDNSRVLM